MPKGVYDRSKKFRVMKAVRKGRAPAAPSEWDQLQEELRLVIDKMVKYKVREYLNRLKEIYIE